LCLIFLPSDFFYGAHRFQTTTLLYFFPTSLMKMILSSLNLVRKIGVCITSEENGESKLTSEESLFNNLPRGDQKGLFKLVTLNGILNRITGVTFGC
jgi:hypothetical protein